MFAMIRQAFSAFTVLFAAIENFATALFNVSEVTKDMSGAFADEQKVEREKKARALQASLAAQQQALGNSSNNTEQVQ